MHEEVLSENQRKLIPLLKTFSTEYGLVGGTAIALQIGHRRSIDFDLVKLGEIKHDQILRSVKENHLITATIVSEPDELTVIVDSVKLTFLKYPFRINFNERFVEHIAMPDVLTLSAMKAYALGRRAKWKDYVDIAFIFKEHTLSEVSGRAKGIFGGEFNEKLFREQLSYFEDIDYSEKIDFLEGFEMSDQKIKEELEALSLETN